MISSIRRFIAAESAGGIVLALAALVALIVAAVLGTLVLLSPLSAAPGARPRP